MDLVIDQGDFLYPVEIKASYTPSPHFIDNLDYFVKLQKVARKTKPLGECVYCGNTDIVLKDFVLKPWFEA